MSQVVTLDADGRLSFPEELRARYHLQSGSRLRLAEEGERIVLEPIAEPAVLVERDGLPLVRGALEEGSIPDHRELREDRIARLSELPVAPPDPPGLDLKM